MSGYFNSRQEQAHHEMYMRQGAKLRTDMAHLEVDTESFSLKNAIILLRKIGYTVSNGEVDKYENKNDTSEWSTIARKNQQYAALASLQTHDLEEMSADEHERIIQEQNAMMIVLDNNYNITPPEQVPFGFTNSMYRR